jgi:DNA-binding transcriptional LysR family regulator
MMDAQGDAPISAGLLWRDPVVVALPPGHGLGSRREISLAELKQEDFVFLRLDSSAFARRLFDACIRAGFAPRITQQVVEIPAALNLVAAGLGVALVPNSLALLRADAVSICQLRPAEGWRQSSGGPDNQAALNGDVYVLWRPDSSTPAVAEFRQKLVGWAQTL